MPSRPTYNLDTTMLTVRIVSLIESQWERIADRAISAVANDPAVPNYNALTDEELRSRAKDLLSNLGHWLARRDEKALAERYEKLGKLRREEGMPLHEVIYKLQLLKRTVLSHARDEHLEMTAFQLYQEQAFLTALDEFFDRIIFHVAKGFSETRVKRPEPLAAAA